MLLKVIIILVIIGALFKVFIYYYERKLIYFPYRELETTPAQFGLVYSEVRLQTADGVKLHGWYLPAAGPVPVPTGESATVLFCHGNAGNMSHRLDKIKPLVDNGIAVLLFDYRGYGRSEGTPSEKGLYADGLAAFNYLIDEKGIPGDSIILFGESIGSAVASHIAATVRDRVAAIILESPFTSARAMAGRILPLPFIPRLVTVNYDNVTMQQQATAPVLIIHGTDDEIVPFSQGRQLFKSISRPMKEFYQVAGAGHNDICMVAGNEYYQKIIAFIGKHTGAKES